MTNDPTRNYPNYPIGARYRISDGTICEVIEHGFLSVKLSGTTLSGWVGTNEMNDWLNRKQFVPMEGDRNAIY